MEPGVDPPEVLERFHAELDLVDIVARQVCSSMAGAVELDDLLSFGRLGLLEAARRFDPSRGVPFRAFANYRVRGAIIDGARATARLPRRTYERLRALEAGLLVSEGAVEDVLVPPPPGATPEGAEQALEKHLAAMATAMAVGLVASKVTVQGEPVTDETPEEAYGRAELLDHVRRAIDELPPDEAELVRRHYLGGERFDHVARDLGLSKSWASRLHTRAVKRLTEALQRLS